MFKKWGKGARKREERIKGGAGKTGDKRRGEESEEGESSHMAVELVKWVPRETPARLMPTGMAVSTSGSAIALALGRSWGITECYSLDGSKTRSLLC